MAERKKTDIERLEGKITWCPGCSYWTLLEVLDNSIKKVGNERYNLPLDRMLENLAAFSGIGCFGRISGYLNFEKTAHSEHGRSIPSAVVYKSVKDLQNRENGNGIETTVFAFGGDGDMLAIGGNHLIHAAKDNKNIVVIVANNERYAMTGNQASPTTQSEDERTSQPYGNVLTPIDPVKLIFACGASYIARGILNGSYLDQAKEIVEGAMKNPGFSFVEFITHCPNHARSEKNKGEKMNAIEFREICAQTFAPISENQMGLSYDEMLKQNNGKLPIGILRDVQVKGYHQRYLELVEKVKMPSAIDVARAYFEKK